MEACKTRKPRPAANGYTAKIQKQHGNGTATFLIREAVSAITLGALFGVILWSCVLGMSGNMGPGKGFVVPPMAENDHGR